MKRAAEQAIKEEEDKVKDKQARAKAMLMEVEKANQQSMTIDTTCRSWSNISKDIWKETRAIKRMMRRAE